MIAFLIFVLGAVISFGLSDIARAIRETKDNEDDRGN